MSHQRLHGRRGPRTRASFLPAFMGIGAALGVAWSCRSPVPDENVYTGRSQTPPRPSSTGGVGGVPSLASGGAPGVASGGAPGVTGGARGTDPTAGEGGGDAPDSAAGGSPNPPPEPPVVTFTKGALLKAAGDCTQAAVRGFVPLVEALRDRCEALRSARTAAHLEAAQHAFREAMAAWQVLEVHRYGPAARKADDPAAGLDLRDQIYAWPLGGRCNIEQQLLNKGYAEPSFASHLINVRGLGTLEYLLFNDDANNACPSYSPMNAQGSWAALGLDEIRARKAAYARAVADDVLTHALSLAAAWDERFHSQLSAAGSKGAGYASEQAALNAVSNALFYVEREVKDKKLALPLGLSADCASGVCPESLESQYAGLSTENIRQNLRGFRQLFWGCGARASGLGFDDWLIAVGAGDLERRMASAFDDAALAFDQLDPPLEQALLFKPEATHAVYQSLKRFTDLLKTEFLGALQLELPAGSETDND